jgi:glycosyltransferase involved in cell wall biosynthesis
VKSPPQRIKNIIGNLGPALIITSQALLASVTALGIEREQVFLIDEVFDEVEGINFSRNFGQHHAITAGVDHPSGDWIVVMDCDLQHQPEEIAKLYRAATVQAYDVVSARREHRKDALFKILASRSFNLGLNALVDVRKIESLASVTDPD